MNITIEKNNGDVVKNIDGSLDEMGVHYRKNDSDIVIIGQEDKMVMVLVPWMAISSIEYTITPDMVKPEEDNIIEVPQNRKARRAGLQ